jgi:CubicO group peptidase (beta-lactamase class C family)
MPISSVKIPPQSLPTVVKEEWDSILQWAVDTSTTAGVEALVLHHDRIIYHEAFGFQRKIPTELPLAKGTLFDLASLTKVVCTTTSVMILVNQGSIRLDAPVWSYLPEFGVMGKEQVLVRHLLTHTSGLPPFLPLYNGHKGRKDFYRALCASELTRSPGEQREYSDLGFMILGWLVEAVSGNSLNQFAHKKIFSPLGMTQSMFNPPYYLRKKCAATEDCPWRKKILQGEVHDENAWQLGGVSGHAGLFSTAEDLAHFALMMLQKGKSGSTTLLSHDLFHELLRPQRIPDYHRQALGWWYPLPVAEATVFLPSQNSYGHTGFTGTSLWIDPEYQAAVILLSNAIHPKRQTAHASAFRKPFHAWISDYLVNDVVDTGRMG